MINYILLGVGIITFVIAVTLMIREFFHNDKNFSNSVYLDYYVKSIDSMEELVNDLNNCFTDTVLQIESKLNHIEKDINILQNRINNIENTTKQNNKLINKHTFDKDPRSIKIFDLKKKGLSNSQIAKELDMGIGEVQLILNINKS